MSNVEVSRAPDRDGKIKLHGPEAFEGMRKAGQLAAEALDMLTPHVKPGVTTETLDELVLRVRPRPRRLSRRRSLSRLPQVDLHLDQPRRLPRHPGRRSRLRDGDIVNIDVTLIVDGWHGDTSRMYPVGHISRRAERLIDVTYEALMRGIAAVKPGATTGHIGAAIQTYAEARALLRRARLLRPRARPRVPRPAQHPALRRAGRGRDAGARHALHHRADDQPRAPAREGAARWLDGGDARPRALRPVRAHRRRDRDRLRGLHASRPRASTAPSSSSPELGFRHAGPRKDRRRRAMRDQQSFLEAPSAALHRATASVCASASEGRRGRAARLRAAGAGAVPRAAAARHQGLAKRLIARFGSFAEVVNAPDQRLKEVEGVGDSVVTELKLVRAAALRLMRVEIVKRPALSSWKAGARLPARGAGL